MKRINIFIAVLLISSSSMFAQSAQQKAEIDKIAELAKTNTPEAVSQAQTLIKQDKKNLDLIIGVGRAFISAEKVNEANSYLEMAKKISPKSAKTYVYAGDIEVAKNDPGTACQNYETAIYYEPKDEAAYFRYADIYKVIDPEGAVAKLKTLKEKRPDLTNVDAKIGEVYYTSNKFDEAVAAYSSIDQSKLDEKSLQNYAFALFMNHKFQQSEDIANVGLQKNPRSAAFNRLAMYNNTDLKNYDEAQKYAVNLFNNSDKAEFSYLDYTYYGYALVGAKKDGEAIEQFKKALSLDDTRIDVLKALADAYDNTEDYNNAVITYKKYLTKLEAKDITPDKVFQLGKMYYKWGTDENKAGSNFAAEKKAALEEADSTFAKVAEMAPDSYLGNFYRARANSALDPDQSKGYAKPYYEAAINIMVAKNDNSKYINQLIEAYRYMGYYYYNKKMMAESKNCYQKILTLDPTSKVAKDALLMFK